MAVNLDVNLRDKNAINAINNLLNRLERVEKELGVVGDKGDMAFKEIGDEAKKTTGEIGNTVKETEELKNELKKTKKEGGDLGKNTKKSTSLMQRGFKSLGKAIKNAFLPLLAVGAIIQSIRRVITIISDFDQATANLAAVTGRSVEEIGALTDQAKELGATTAFTATEVTALQTELAKLGFAESEILASTGAIQNLAIAAGGDLARAASLAGSTLRAFELDASEAGRVVDVIAKSFSISALDISKFETAISTVAPVANSAGVSIEETTALLGTLVDAGIEASTAGTGLRNAFLKIAEEGITLEEALGKIQNATDKNVVALDLFGTRGATVGTVLASNTDKAEAYTKILENAAGASDEFARKQLDTLSGQLTLLRSAFEGFILSLDSGEGVISQVLRSFTRLGIAFFDFLNVSRDARTEGQKQVDALKNQAAQADVLFTTLKNVKNELKDTKEGTEEYNRLQEVQSQVLSELNKEYGEYLPNLLTQKSSIQEISEAQKELNRQLFREQLIISFKEEINAAIEKEIEARKNLTEAARAEASELTKRENEALAAAGASAGQLQQQQQVFTALSKGVRAVNEEQLTEAQESQVRIKALYKDLFSEIGEDFETLFLKGGSSGGTIISEDGSTPASQAASKLKDELEKLQTQLEDSAKQASIELIGDPRARAKAQYDLVIEEIENQQQKILELAEKAGNTELDIQEEIDTLKLLAKRKYLEELLKLDEEIQPLERGFNFDSQGQLGENIAEDLQASTQQAEGAILSMKDKIAVALGLSREEFGEFEQAVSQTFNSIFEGITAGIDAQIAEQDALIQSIRQQEEAIRDGLEAELDRREEGYASNVEAKRKQLEQLQAEEEAAVKKRTELQRRQAQIELAINATQQAANLATAVSEIFKANSGTPIVGIALAAAAAASMFALFQQFKAQSQQAAVVPQLYKGGSVREALDGYVEKGGRNDRPGTSSGYRVVDDLGNTRMRIGGSEMVMNELASREHEPFLKALNMGKYKGVDITKALTANIEPVRMMGKNNEVIVKREQERDSLTEKQMDKLLMKLADRISEDQDKRKVRKEEGGKVVIENKGRRRKIR